MIPVLGRGSSWAERQAERARLVFEPLDNGFRSCADAQALQAICARLSHENVWRFFRRWQHLLPSPFTRDDRARGYRYQLAFRQLELSDTRFFDRPQVGREWFERHARDQLALGRPDQVAIVFGRRISARRPACFEPRHPPRRRGRDPDPLPRLEGEAIPQGRARAPHRDDRQRHARLRHRPTGHERKLGGARPDRPRGKRPPPRRAARRLRVRARRRHARARSPALARRQGPARAGPSLRRSPRDGAALGAVLLLHLLEGITNRSLHPLVAGLLPGYRPRLLTYDLRRNGFLVRIAGSHRYQ